MCFSYFVSCYWSSFDSEWLHCWAFSPIHHGLGLNLFFFFFLLGRAHAKLLGWLSPKHATFYMAVWSEPFARQVVCLMWESCASTMRDFQSQLPRKARPLELTEPTENTPQLPCLTVIGENSPSANRREFKKLSFVEVMSDITAEGMSNLLMEVWKFLFIIVMRSIYPHKHK